MRDACAREFIRLRPLPDVCSKCLSECVSKYGIDRAAWSLAILQKTNTESRVCRTKSV